MQEGGWNLKDLSVQFHDLKTNFNLPNVDSSYLLFLMELLQR